MKSRTIIFGLLLFVGLVMGSLMALDPEPWCDGTYTIVAVPQVATAGTKFTLSGQFQSTSQCLYPAYQRDWLVEVSPPNGLDAPARRLLLEGWSYVPDNKEFNLGTGVDWEGWTIVAWSHFRCTGPMCFYEAEDFKTWIIQAP